MNKSQHSNLQRSLINLIKPINFQRSIFVFDAINKRFKQMGEFPNLIITKINSQKRKLKTWILGKMHKERSHYSISSQELKRLGYFVREQVMAPIAEENHKQANQGSSFLGWRRSFGCPCLRPF